MLDGARRRAKAERLPFNLTVDDIRIPERCPALGIALRPGKGRITPNSPTLDRVVSELGYTRGNVVVVSWKANSTKSDLKLHQLEQLVKFYKGLTNGSLLSQRRQT